MIRQSLLPWLSLLLLLPLLQGCVEAVVIGGAAGMATAASDRRSTGQMIDDQAIEMTIAARYGEQPAMWQDAHVKVVSYNGIVLLAGEVPSPALRGEAVTIARQAEGVRRVHDQLVIAPAASFSDRTADLWLATRVKTALLGMEDLDHNPMRIKVVTRGGTVYLMGLVRRSEADAVVEKVRVMRGVKKVVKLFEYLD